MEKRAYGKTDMQVSVLGFGGAEIGFEGATPAQVEKLLNDALDSGLNVIDTAECYANSEELIGQTVASRRDDYFLFTKCGHASGFDLPNWDPKLLELSIDRSLRRLRTDYVDVIHLHTCSEETLRRGEAIEVLQRAKEKGKTRYIGYSGDHTDALYAVRTDAFDSLMTSVNVADQEAIELTLPEAAARGMGVIVKRPIANFAWRYDAKPDNAYHQAYWQRLQKLDYEALRSKDERSVGTALRFALAVPGVHTAIVGTKNPKRWRTNSALLDEGPLPEETYRSIRERWKEAAEPDWIGLE